MDLGERERQQRRNSREIPMQQIRDEIIYQPFLAPLPLCTCKKQFTPRKRTRVITLNDPPRRLPSCALFRRKRKGSRARKNIDEIGEEWQEWEREGNASRMAQLHRACFEAVLTWNEQIEMMIRSAPPLMLHLLHFSPIFIRRSSLLETWPKKWIARFVGLLVRIRRQLSKNELA